MAKKDNSKLIIGFAIILAALIIAPNLDFSTTVNQQTLEQLETAQDGTCYLSLNKNVIDAGDSITGKITDGANTLCTIYGNLDSTGWIEIGEGTTNSLGEISVTDTLNIPGDFEFRAICGSCVTNTVHLIVNPIVTLECSDTDGINEMTPGHVTYEGVSYYDKCAGNWAVTEYYCNGDVNSKVIACDAGYICTATRSGDYCSKIPTWENGDVVGSGSGSGSSSLPYNVFEIDLSDFTDGTCGLMATIDAGWTYGNQNCQGIQGSEGVHWMFHDSDSLEWERIDTTPTSLGHATECVLDWDRQTPFHLEMSKLLLMPECEINYEYNVQVLACNC